VPPDAATVTEYATPFTASGNGEAVVIFGAGALTTIDRALDEVCEALSVTWTVKLLVPDAAGVPLITPAVVKVKPAGSAPAATDHVCGGVPPVAAKVWEYDVPTVAAGKGATVVIENGDGVTVIESDFDAAWEAASATWTVKIKIPAVVGNPLITPVVESVNPWANVPATTDQEYGGVPPVAAKVWEYDAPTVAAGKGDAVVIDGVGRLIAIESDLDAVWEPLSVTWTVKLAVPGVVGDPLITPAAERLRPTGNAPDTRDQE